MNDCTLEKTDKYSYKYCLDNYILENNYDSPLSKEEEIKLFERYKLKNDIEARDKLLFHNIRIAKKHIKTKRNYLVSLTEEELYQQAVVVTLANMKKFDYTRGINFTTFLYNAIHNNINRYIMNVDRAIRIPVNKLSLFTKIVANIKSISEKMDSNSYVTYEMLKEHMNLSKRDYISYVTTYKPTYSLDDELGNNNDNESTKLMNLVSSGEDIEEDYQKKILIAKVYSIIETLEYNERLVIEDYILDGKTYLQIEKETGIAKDELIKCKKLAIKKIKKALVKGF